MLNAIPHLQVRDAEHILSVEQLHTRLRCKIAIQLSKGLYYFQVLCKYGGWFTDFDYDLLRESRPVLRYWFITGPAKSTGYRARTHIIHNTRHDASGYVHLGMMMMLATSPFDRH